MHVFTEAQQEKKRRAQERKEIYDSYWRYVIEKRIINKIWWLTNVSELENMLNMSFFVKIKTDSKSRVLSYFFC